MSFGGLCRGAWGAQGRSLGTSVQARVYLKAVAAAERLSQWTEDPGKRIFEVVQVAGSFSEVSPLRSLLARAWEGNSWALELYGLSESCKFCEFPEPLNFISFLKLQEGVFQFAGITTQQNLPSQRLLPLAVSPFSVLLLPLLTDLLETFPLRKQPNPVHAVLGLSLVRFCFLPPFLHFSALSSPCPLSRSSPLASPGLILSFTGRLLMGNRVPTTL